jgi:hypothetical protein
MRPAGPAHSLIVVQSTRKKDGETAAQRNRGSGRPWPSATRRAPAPHAHGGPVRAGKLAGRGSPDHPILPAAQTLAGMSHDRIEAPGRALHAGGHPPAAAAEAC